MSEQEQENGEEQIDESGRNPTQREIDEENREESPGEASPDSDE